MNVQSILTTISDEEILILSGKHGSVAVERDDRIEIVDGEEFVFVQTSVGEFPVPTSEFNEATVMTQAEFIMHCMATM